MLDDMRFGLMKLTLLDYPGKIASTVFTYGCNFRCPFCHNASLVTGDNDLTLTADGIINFLKSRVGIIDGVCVTGGEPLLYKDILVLLKSIKDLGFKVKLDTNGSFPEILKDILNQKLVDYVAMDIKTSIEKYSLVSGVNTNVQKIKDSVTLLMNSDIDYEFRTTVVNELHTIDDFKDIVKWIAGAKHYYLQNFEDSGDIVDKSRKFTAMPKEQLIACLAIVKQVIPNAEIRGLKD